MDKKFLLINKEEWNNNYEYYKNLEIEQGIKIMGHSYRSEPKYPSLPTIEELVPPKEDESPKKSIPEWQNGDVVKEWEIKLRSIKNNEDITVKGVTTYEESVFSLIPFTIFTVAHAAAIFILIGLLVAVLIIIYTFIYKRKSRR